MDTMSAYDANIRFPRVAPVLPRQSHSAAVVIAFYLLIALGAPWIVRYAPSAEAQAAEQLVRRAPVIRCATAPEFGMPCGLSEPGYGTRVQTSTRSMPPALARAT